MIKYVKVTTDSTKKVRTVDFSLDGAIKYIGQSGTSGYASAAKGYLADYVLRNIPITWTPLCFDNSTNDKSYYVDALAESVINKSYSKLYYQQHKARLIKLNKINYKIRNPNPNRNGRPKIYHEEEEMVLSC
jgi:hypothetical protein